MEALIVRKKGKVDVAKARSNSATNDVEYIIVIEFPVSDDYRFRRFLFSNLNSFLTLPALCVATCPLDLS